MDGKVLDCKARDVFSLVFKGVIMVGSVDEEA